MILKAKELIEILWRDRETEEKAKVHALGYPKAWGTSVFGG